MQQALFAPRGWGGGDRGCGGRLASQNLKHGIDHIVQMAWIPGAKTVAQTLLQPLAQRPLFPWTGAGADGMLPPVLIEDRPQLPDVRQRFATAPLTGQQPNHPTDGHRIAPHQLKMAGQQGLGLVEPTLPIGSHGLGQQIGLGGGMGQL